MVPDLSICALSVFLGLWFLVRLTTEPILPSCTCKPSLPTTHSARNSNRQRSGARMAGAHTAAVARGLSEHGSAVIRSSRAPARARPSGRDVRRDNDRGEALMPAANDIRRVVTTHDASGKAIVGFDNVAPQTGGEAELGVKVFNL